MTRGKAAKDLDFEALRFGIEGNAPELVLGFYAEDAQLRIVNADAPENTPFELCGKAEIAKHLRAVFGQKSSHRVEREVVDEDRVTFREACEYPDGGRVWVETTLEVREGMIVRQVDVVSRDTQADRKDEIGQRPPIRKTYPDPHPGADVSPSERLLRSKPATEKEDLR
jgi:hypothetical protein